MFASIFAFIVLCLPACDDPGSSSYTSDEDYCHNKGTLYCSDEEGGCCDRNVPYSDGHGTCWGTLAGCRQTGWACSKCW